jgi:hypothetical protein
VNRSTRPSGSERSDTARLLIRAAGAVFAVLVFAGSATADVFVPVDLPARSGECGSGAGDVLASGRSRFGERWKLDISERRERWRRLPGAGGCPAVAAAPDGTAAIAAYDDEHVALAVRRPGGGFGARVLSAAGTGDEPRVAVAPGGWAAIGWLEPTLSGTTDVVVAVVAPDGSVRRAVLDRSGAEDTDVFLSLPRIGIDAAGTTTAAWSRVREDYEVRSLRLRTARSAGGTGWTAPTELPTGSARTARDLEVAVSPAGHTLLAWATGRGIQAALDGEPAATLTGEPDAASPAPAVTDDGTALVAYAAPRRRIMAVDRPAGGAWSAPHRVSGTREGRPARLNESAGGPEIVLIASVIGADGRAVVAWPAYTELGRIAAAAGRVGGAWSAATAVSRATRWAQSPSLALDARGAPQLLWEESTSLAHHERLRGARLTPETEAPAPDRRAPALSVRFPAQLRLSRRGRIRTRVRVRCSEACDVRARLIVPRSHGLELAPANRGLGPRRAGRVAIATHADEAPRLKHARRLRVAVLVTDRAGNIARRSRVVRVRVRR